MRHKRCIQKQKNKTKQLKKIQSKRKQHKSNKKTIETLNI